MQEIDYSSLDFGYHPTDYIVRCTWSNGTWSEVEAITEFTFPIHVSAACLHYGQLAFEGMKAYRCADGHVRIFRPDFNGERMQRSCRALAMPELPIDRFIEMVEQVVRLNERHVPPYGTGASLYIRPVMIATTPQIGVHAAHDYLFFILTSPVGAYFKGGFQSNPYVITRDFDRAAPKGTGRFKVAANYAGSLLCHRLAVEQGYSSEMYLDSKEHKYIDEAGAANFFGIKNGVYVTPQSDSVLPSVTNDSLVTIARDLGIKVERRQIPVEELAEMQEAGACGTGAVIVPIERIDDPAMNRSYVFGEPGPVTCRLYKALTAIQLGEAEDKHGWTRIVI